MTNLEKAVLYCAAALEPNATEQDQINAAWFERATRLTGTPAEVFIAQVETEELERLNGEAPIYWTGDNSGYCLKWNTTTHGSPDTSRISYSFRVLCKFDSPEMAQFYREREAA